MPEKLNEKLVYDVDINGEIESGEERETYEQDLKIAIELRETNRDDSLLLQIEFAEAKWREQDGTDWNESPLQGSSFFVTAFPWGEMLKIDGWDALPEDPHLDSLDIIIPLLFPNPPVREAQQWNYRVLPWKYLGELPENYLRLNQKIIANWTKESEQVWAYKGEWEAKTRLDRILEGNVSGTLSKSGVWIDTHEWDWSREILFPETEKQHFKGKILRIGQK